MYVVYVMSFFSYKVAEYIVVYDNFLNLIAIVSFAVPFAFPFIPHSFIFSAHCSCLSPAEGGGGQTMPATIQSTITNMNF